MITATISISMLDDSTKNGHKIKFKPSIIQITPLEHTWVTEWFRNANIWEYKYQRQIISQLDST